MSDPSQQHMGTWRRAIETWQRAVTRRAWLPLLLLTLVALAVRLGAWAYFGTGTIESEGAEYARIAQNLRNGVGFVGLVSAGPQVLFPPLYPLLIAGVSYLTNDFELAGRLVSLGFGSLLPLVTFGISSRIFDRRIGFISAGVALAHPLPIYQSFMVYSEGPYAVLLLCVIYFGLRVMEGPSPTRWLPVGASCALAYLMRPEGFALCAISGVFALLATKGGIPARLKAAACLSAAFLLLALPEVAFLHKATGRFTFETKSAVLFSYTGGRVLAADTNPGKEFELGGLRDVPSPEPDVPGGYPDRWQDKWATFGVNSRFEETGLSLRPFADMARSPPLPFKTVVALLKKGLGLNGPMFFKRVSARWIGVLLPLVALLGAMRRPRRNPLGRLYVAAVSAAPILATFFVLWNDDRYYFIFVPILSIWAGSGLVEAGNLGRALAERIGLARFAPPLLTETVGPALLATMIVITPVRAVASNYEFTDSGRAHLPERQIASWLGRQTGNPGRVLDLVLPFSYHAGASKHVFPPYCSPSEALSYLDAAQVDYVVLRPGRKLMKYYSEWATTGIPDERAELVALPPIEGGEPLKIYRWHHSGGNLGALKKPAEIEDASGTRRVGQRPFFTDFSEASSALRGAWQTQDPTLGQVTTLGGLAFRSQDTAASSKLYLSRFPANHMATAILHKSQTSPRGLAVELLLRWSDSASAGSANGYACTLQDDGRLLVRRSQREQPLFDSSTSPSLLPHLGVHDQDVFSAQIVGDTVTVRLNGTLIASVRDPQETVHLGNPGVGFSRYGSENSDPKSFCFSSFSAQAL